MGHFHRNRARLGILLLTCALAGFAGNAQGQRFILGLKGGLSITDQRVPEPGGVNAKSGACVGLTTMIVVSRHYVIQLEALGVEKWAGYYAEIPFLLRYDIHPLSGFCPYIIGGGFLAMETDEGELEGSHPISKEYGMTLGGGLQGRNLFLELRLSRGLDNQNPRGVYGRSVMLMGGILF